MRTYIINLKRSVDRRAHIIKEAERCELDYKIVEAVDGGAVPEEEILRHTDMEVVSRHRDWLSNRAIATSLSHRKVYEAIISDNVEVALILEDDARLLENFSSVLEAIPKRVKGSEVVLLHYISFAPLGLSTQSEVELVDGRKLMFPLHLEGVGSAAAYVITQAAARKLFDNLLPLQTAADSWYDFTARGWLEKVRVLYKPVVSLIGAKSTIYIDSQSGFRSKLTELVDRYRIPVFSTYLRRKRLANVAKMSKFYITEEKSGYDQTGINVIERVP